MYFPASYDGLAKGVSAAVLLLFAGIALYTQSLVAMGVGVIAVLGAYAFSPRGYRCAGRAIEVQRLFRPAREPLDDLRDVRLATGDDLKGSVRLFGSSGMFGYYGVFRTSALGTCTWYATRRNKMVVVITGTRTTLYSPDDPWGFVEAVREMVPTPAGTIPRATVPAGGGARWKLGVGAAVATVTALVAAALFYDPGIPRYTLTADALTIHDPCFYSVTVHKGEVDLHGARVIDFGIDREWRPTMRTNGFANTKYASGWFRAANGKKMRMYRAHGSRLVLLPPQGAGDPILYQAADPDRFLDELRRTW